MEDIDNEEIIGLQKDAAYQDRLPRGYLSVSQITQYAKCGMAYYFRYILEVPVRSNSYMAQGSALHSGAEKMHIAMYDGDVPPVEYVEQAYEGALTKYFDPGLDVEIMEEDVDLGRIKDTGMEMIRIYHKGAGGNIIDPETKKPMRKLYPVAAERVVRTMLEVPDAEPVPFLGVIDIEEPHTVRDLKTKRKLGTQSEADNSLQLSLYAAVSGKPDVSIDQLVRKTKTLPARYIRREAHRTQQEIAHAKQIASETAEDIAKGRFRLTMPDSWWCSENWCAYWDRCRGKKS